MRKNPTIEQSIADCIYTLRATKADSTVTMYSLAIEVFGRIAQSEGLQKCQELSINEFVYYVNFLARKNLASRSRRVYCSAISYYLHWLLAFDYIQCTLHDLERFKTAVKQHAGKIAPTNKFVSEEQILAILDQAKMDTATEPIYSRNYAMLNFLYTSGCRVSEMVSLTVANILNWEGSGYISIIGKGQKIRQLFTTEKTVDLIKSYWNKISSSRYLIEPAFLRHDSRAQNKCLALSAHAVRAIIARLVIDAGMEKGSVTPHSFRHAFATKMLAETQNLALVQDLLGHSSPETTRIYAKLSVEQLKNSYYDIWRKK